MLSAVYKWSFQLTSISLQLSYILHFCSSLIFNIEISISGKTIQSLWLQMSLLQTTLHWCCGFSQQCWNTSKHPGGPKMLCQIKLNQWIPLQDPPHFQTDPGPVRSALPAQSQKRTTLLGYVGTTPLSHSLTVELTTEMNENLMSIQTKQRD